MKVEDVPGNKLKRKRLMFSNGTCRHRHSEFHVLCYPSNKAGVLLCSCVDYLPISEVETNSLAKEKHIMKRNYLRTGFDREKYHHTVIRETLMFSLTIYDHV